MSQRRFTPFIALIMLVVVAGPALAAPPDAAGSGRQAADGPRHVLPHERPAGSITPQSVPPGTVGVVSSIGYQDASSIAIVGEVLNNTTSRRLIIEVRATLYNASHVAVGMITDVAFTDRLGYGSLTPFILFDDSPPAGAATFTVAVIDPGNPITTPLGGILGKTINPVQIVGSTRTYSGTITNPSTSSLVGYVAVTTYDSTGDVIDATWTNQLTLGSHATVPYSLPLFYDPAVPVARAAITGQAWVPSNTAIYLGTIDNYFDDVGLSPFRNDILWLAESGITTGCAAGKYCPTANVRRDQMASFLARGMGLTGSAPNAFTDDEGNPHEANINLIAKAGITSGCSVGHFCPSGNVHRDEMASFLSRAAGLTGTAPNAFTDDNGNTHEANINLVAQAGITTGCGGSNYCPTRLVTRGQMAAFLRRAFD